MKRNQKLKTYISRVLTIALYSLVAGLLASSLLAANAQAACVQPNDLNRLTTNALHYFRDRDRYFPNTLLIQSNLEGNISSSSETIGFENTKHNQSPTSQTQVSTHGELEAIYRPIKSGYYSLLPIPALGFELSRNDSLIYVCAHLEAEVENSQVVIYFLRGHKLDGFRVSNMISDLLYGEKISVQPMSLSLLGAETLNDGIFNSKSLGIFKLLSLPLLPYDMVQKFSTELISSFTKLGVERITIRAHALELATGVDLQNPNEALIRKTIEF